MDRRELLKMIAVLTGSAVVGSEFFLSGCTAGAKAEVGFTPANLSFLNEVGETILPATATPGAKEAKVGEFMKVYVTDCYPQNSQDAFIKGINDLDEASRKMHSKGFMDCTPEQRTKLLISLEKEAEQHNRDQTKKDMEKQMEKENKEKEFAASPPHYYTMMKQLTMLGFFTSEVGATKAMRHIAVPHTYNGALPYKKGDKAWAD